MRPSPGIVAKLFAAILLTNVVTAVAVGLGVRSAFDSGFERYVREREDERLSRLATTLAAAYRTGGGWDSLKGNPSAWFEMNHAARAIPMPPPGAPTKTRDFDRRGPDAPRGPDFDKGPPGTPGPSGGPGQPGPRGMRDRAPPAQVLDEAGALVAGDAELTGEIDRRPILIDGKRVGWLATPVRIGAFDFADRRFREQHWQAVWLVALAALALAAIVAACLARGLLAPVKRIASATRRLADGDYATRVTRTSADELGRLVDDFNRLGHALEQHEASRRHFMADASHELRTPIAVLKGEIEALQDGVRAPTPEALASLHTEVARLGKLVDELHDLSLSGAGGLSYRFGPVALGDVVAEAIEQAGARLAQRRIEVAIDAPMPVVARGDADRLHQAIANLLENTLRYTDEGGMLRVTLRRDGAKAVLTWDDSAPGVPTEALPRLFDRFFRVEASRNRESGGSGLGLAIVKGIVEAHGGTITARASALGGLGLEIRLPAAEDA